jgi:nickel transport protein
VAGRVAGEWLNKMAGRGLRWGWLAILAWGFWGWLAPSQVWAHGVYIFGWAEGDRICTDSYFSRSNKVQGGLVRIKGSEGQILDEGETDERGGVCFPRPQAPGDYLLEVEAGEGHRAEFTLRAEDLPPLEPKSAAESTPTPTPEPTERPLGVEGALDAASLIPVTEEKLRALIQEELRAQLSPINRALAENRKPDTPGFREIFGGLGWLVGVFGLSAWLWGRRRAKS